MKQNLVNIDILSTLKFYDEAVPESDHHATAINAVAGEDLGVGLLIHYFRQKNLKVEVLPEKCNPGTRSGFRLDKWIRVKHNGKSICYQTEIKNWSAHAIGGRKLDARASDTDLAAHKIERWKNQWNGSTFRARQARKVLIPMKRPKPNCKVEPLICFWDALHPVGKREPLFSVKINDPNFSRVWIFSMSAYLRELHSSGIKRVTIEMPDTVIRLIWLARILKVP